MNIKGWMLGRGLLTNPLLVSEKEQSSEIFLKTLKNLHDAFYQNLVEFGYSEGQILNHLKCLLGISVLKISVMESEFSESLRKQEN